MPTGLSSTTQPCTSRFSRLALLRRARWTSLCRRRRVVRRARCLRVIIRPDPLRGRAAPRASAAASRSAPLRRIARRARKRMSGANFRLTRCAISPRRYFLLRSSASSTVVDVLAAERHDVDRREPQVGGHAHFRDVIEVAFEHRVMHVAARQHLGHRVADQFADAQLALRRRLVVPRRDVSARAMVLRFVMPGLVPGIRLASNIASGDGSPAQVRQ